MILVLAQAALASSCCAGGGAQPAILDGCDNVGIAFGVQGGVEYGGWSLDRSWSEVGDDGGGDATVSVSLLGRFAPWLQGGLRVPVTLGMDRLDGEVAHDLRMEDALGWVDLETPDGWPSARFPRVGVSAGLGSDVGREATPGALRMQVGLRMSIAPAPWTVWGSAYGRVPIAGGTGPEGEISVAVDHSVGTALRVGLGVGVVATAGSAPSYSPGVGPTIIFAPNHSDRIVFEARAGVPIDGLGQSAPSRFVLSVDWFRVLAHGG